MERHSASVARYAFDVEIHASVEKVWTLLTSEIGTWWPADFNSSPDTKQFVLEPVVGGRMYEDQGDGDGVLWGTIVQISSFKRLQIQGAMFPEYGGPGSFILSYTLEPSAVGCLLKVSDAQYGYISDEQVQETKSGWMQIADRLKQAAEAA